MSQQEEGGFHTFCQLFSKLYFYDQLSPLLLQNVMTTAFLAFAFVCVLLQLYTKGYPDSCSPSGDNCVWRWKRGREGSWRESLSRLDLAGEAFLPSVQPSLSKHKSQGSSSQRQLSLILRDFTAALVQNFVSYRNSPKQWQSLFVRFLFPSLSYYPLLWCVVTQRQGTPDQKKNLV